MSAADGIGLGALLLIVTVAAVFTLAWRKRARRLRDETAADRYRRDVSHLHLRSLRRDPRRARVRRHGVADVWAAAGAPPSLSASRRQRFVAWMTLGAFGAYSVSPSGGDGSGDGGSGGGGCGGGGCGGGGCGGGS